MKVVHCIIIEKIKILKLVMTDFILLTANFNTTELTNTMIRSFRKQYGENIETFVIDNSTTEHFTTTLKNVSIIDNFKFKNTPNLNCPSKNHCISINYAFSLIPVDNIILVDSDILFYPSIKKLIENFTFEKYDLCGEIGHDVLPTNRLFPYLCLINLKKIKEKGIAFFRENGIIKGVKDTGASFLEECEKENLKIKEIKLSDYILHLKGATLNAKNWKEWIENNKNLWKI